MMAAPPPPALPVLYSFRRCPYAMRARLAIAVAGLPHQHREVVLKNKPPELLAASPKGTVPVLVLPGGEVIDQSLDIMQWALAQHDPEGWLPDDPALRDDMQALIAANDGPFKRQLDRYKYPHRYPQESGGDAVALAAVSRDAGASWLMKLDTQLAAAAHSQTPVRNAGEASATCWLFGDRPRLADMALLPFVRQFAHTDADWFAAQPWPHLKAWLAGFEAGGHFKATMGKHEPWCSAQIDLSDDLTPMTR